MEDTTPVFMPVPVGPMARPEPGSKIGDFVVEALVGDGGFATVHRCHDSASGDEVVVKRLHNHLSATPSARARFVQEVELLRKLRHERVVRYVASGTDDQHVPYLVMEWMPGGDLSRLLARRGRFGLDEVVAVARDVGAALQAAHALGIIHRDVKLQNILVESEDPLRCKLVDFGVAGFRARVGGLTRSGESVGTPRSMAPEQILGQRADGRTDVYALGLVLFHLLTGHAAYGGGTSAEVFDQQLNAPIPRVSDVVEVPVAVDAVLSRALAKLPAARYDAAVELAEALARAAAPVAAALVRHVAVYVDVTGAEAPAALARARRGLLIEGLHLDVDGDGLLLASRAVAAEQIGPLMLALEDLYQRLAPGVTMAMSVRVGEPDELGQPHLWSNDEPGFHISE